MGGLPSTGVETTWIGCEPAVPCEPPCREFLPRPRLRLGSLPPPGPPPPRLSSFSSALPPGGLKSTSQSQEEGKGPLVENNHFSGFSDSDCDGAEGSSVRTKRSGRYFPQQTAFDSVRGMFALPSSNHRQLSRWGLFPSHDTQSHSPPTARSVQAVPRHGLSGLHGRGPSRTCCRLRTGSRTQHTAGRQKKSWTHISNVIPALGSHGPSKRSCEKNKD